MSGSNIREEILWANDSDEDMILHYAWYYIKHIISWYTNHIIYVLPVLLSWRRQQDVVMC